MPKQGAQRVRGKELAACELLILLTKGTYGRFDEAYSGIQLGLALVAEDRKASIFLLNDGVFAAVRGQGPTAVGKSSLSRDLTDFMDLGGELYALKDSLTTRNLTQRDILERTRIVNLAYAATLIQTH
ncbi:MAG: DsrE family protein, partial [Candidatus Bathyarchaeia archaeon]